MQAMFAMAILLAATSTADALVMKHKQATSLPPPPPDDYLAKNGYRGGSSSTSSSSNSVQDDIWATSCLAGWDAASSLTGEAKLADLKKKFDCYTQKRQMAQTRFSKKEVDLQDATKAWGEAAVANAADTSTLTAKEQALQDSQDSLAAASAQLEVAQAAVVAKTKEVATIYANTQKLEIEVGTAATAMSDGAAKTARTAKQTAKTAYGTAWQDVQDLNAKWSQAAIDYDAANVAFLKDTKAALTADQLAAQETAATTAATAEQAAADKRKARMDLAAAKKEQEEAQAAVASASTRGNFSSRSSSFNATAVAEKIATDLAAVKAQFSSAGSKLSTMNPTTKAVCAPRIEIDGAGDLQREAMAVYYLSSDEPRPDAKAADGVVRLAYVNAYGQKLRYSAAEQGWLVDNAHQSGDGKAILWSASDTVCPSLAINWQVFKYNDANGKAIWTSTNERLSANKSHVVVLPLNKVEDFPACASTVTMTNVANVETMNPDLANKAGGTYTIIDKISGADHRGRPVYENANGTQLYYWGADEAWLLDPAPANGARRTKGSGVASSSASVECPTDAKGWVVWNAATKAWAGDSTLAVA